MQAAPLLPLLLFLLSHSGWTSALCNLENGTMVRCSELEDVKYIETYDLESLKASATDDTLSPGLFKNLTSLRHLDLSNGNLKHIEPASFRELANLRSLDLSDNRIEYLQLASLDGLNQLRELNFCRNDLRQLPPALARLKNLRQLHVEGNPFECNCATLRVRDLIGKKGVKMSKKVICAGPSNLKGTSLLKPEAGIICAFEEQDREMQKDQGYEGSGEEDEGSGDIFNEIEEEDEFVEVDNSHSTKEPEVETAYPETAGASTVATTAAETTTKSTTNIPNYTIVTDASLERTTEEDELFFESEEKKDRHSTTIKTFESENDFKDSLFYPVEASGDEIEGSAEGSGEWLHEDEEKIDDVTSVQPSTSSSGDSILDILFGSFWGTTAAPDVQKEVGLEEEQFIYTSSTEAPVVAIITKKVFAESVGVSAAAETTTTTVVHRTTSMAPAVELVESGVEEEASRSGDVKADIDEEGELAEVSPARQSKKGMGSYVVLAALLAVLAALIGFAAYKGDFCRKRRKRGDVETGTELKDMQKSLLDNTTQPKIASNGNPESVPLVEGTQIEQEDSRDNIKSCNDDHHVIDAPAALNGTSDHTDPVKPPRKSFPQQDEPVEEEQLRQNASTPKSSDSLPIRRSPVQTVASDHGPTTIQHPPEPNGPPLSPGAQRVKITLQENPDSVPKTPILITRTMAGENLVKTP